ncbi:hypothetical protein [Caulobacter endophyticus]|uniref:Uncharacterized protein n=1 Tax=Caulobacter endophyticus TaxID=2172652 RepID=A0A2T9KA36_9CAUL|nr:hypothetical protein [Caulobacter endophyticus]PVM92691.1 hypothetical protein DDF67_05375 [Caulobacter endophyticus]
MQVLKRSVLAGLAIAAAGSPALACVMAPPAGPEVQRRRTLDFQASLWDRSEVVFVALLQHPKEIWLQGAGGAPGREAALKPILQLKGPPTATSTTIRHTSFTSCGPAPALDALDPTAGDMFVVYSSSALPTGASIIGTISPEKLVEPKVRAAWSEAYGRKASPR